MGDERQGTHWQGCWRIHPECSAPCTPDYDHEPGKDGRCIWCGTHLDRPGAPADGESSP